MTSADPASAADYDNDGWPDVFHRFWDEGDPELLHNEGNGQFGDRSRVLPDLQLGGHSGGPVLGDYDNDGDLDLFYPYMAPSEGFPRDEDLLLRNDRGRFVEVTQEAGLGGHRASTWSLWLDYDRDGWLDLYVGRWDPDGVFDDDQQDILYRNNGDGTFVDVTVEAGLDVVWHRPDSPVPGSSGGTSTGGVAADFNDDGWTDLFVPVVLSPNRLFINEAGRFRDATTGEIGIAAENYGGAAGDIDNDGDLDLYAASPSGVAADEASGSQRSTLLLNLGEGVFLDVTEGVGLQALVFTDNFFGRFFDFDNDGDLDLFTNNGLPDVFENSGDGTFIERPFQSGVFANKIHADYDNDGFVDTFVDLTVYRNRGNDHHALFIDLVGVQSNRDGLGTRVFATTGDLRQMRELISQDGWFQDPLVLHFGLGEHTAVDQLEVHWPSGQIDVLDNIPADQEIRIIEGRNEWYPAPRTVWETPPPATIEFGETLQLNAVVRPALFEPTATITAITADLSSLGGPTAVPLIDQQDGTYRLEAEFTISDENNLRDVEVFIEQATSLGPYWINLSRNIEVENDPTAVLEEYAALLPESFTLEQNYPNPFNSGTVIRFALPRNEDVELSLYNLSGQKVVTLVSGLREAGTYAVRWDGRDGAGRALASGIYLYRLRTGGGQEKTRKLLLLR